TSSSPLTPAPSRTSSGHITPRKPVSARRPRCRAPCTSSVWRTSRSRRSARRKEVPDELAQAHRHSDLPRHRGDGLLDLDGGAATTMRRITVRVDGKRLDELVRLAKKAGSPYESREHAAESSLAIGLNEMLLVYRTTAK